MAKRPPDEARTEDMREGLLAPGQVLGGRYQVQSKLGSGGMGEVWQAFDLKLRVEVALKALREGLFADEQRLELLRREVRAARDVVSPNVCRIFDLVEADGRELVSMEYVDGQTLLEVLQERGPLELKEAQDIASQFLAGLEAIHASGLVHRDVKPENIMLTRAGRVVVMDFGLARQGESGVGSVSGTPAYMAPEQAAGLTVDARADVYSAGVVLAEMVSPEGIRSFESRRSVWEGVRSQPAKLPDTPWAPVLRKAVARQPEQRYASAHTLTRALEEVTLRVEGAEDRHPYPGLASFTEEDAEYFFGREAEVEQVWRRFDRPRLMALIGPSGAGKSSFLRAGLAPAKPPGWAHVICTPGEVPLAALRRAVISEVEGDSEALRELAVGDEDATVSAVTRWRRRQAHALVVVDQFEELFTLNSAEVQESFAEILSRLALEADAHVLLSMRDDFLMRCNEHEVLAPIFSELMPLKPLEGTALRRALVQPAMTCGYRFEDDELVDEMLTEVEGERGALPLLAFAAARLWERRDREAGLLTRHAYHGIGGVGGALARHAEATIERIGPERVALVRELFRNLVTAEGTRAVREWGELLSVFKAPQRHAAEEVLRELIDARLLTSYEVHEEESEPTRRVEIVHESLLANWPRLLRWRTQDADAVQLRDQLRQAAHTWDEHERPDDLLWTGSAFREYQVWRERYPGGLSEVEEAFAVAMTALATRRRRRRRLAIAAAGLLLAVLAGVFGTLWRRGVRENRRAEAAKLLALAQAALPRAHDDAMAYTIASLRLSDTLEARRFAVRALWAGPAVHMIPGTSPWGLAFSPDGTRLAAGDWSGEVHMYPSDGGPPVVFEGFEERGEVIRCSFDRNGAHLLASQFVPGARFRTRVWASADPGMIAAFPGIGWFSDRAGAPLLSQAPADDESLGAAFSHQGLLRGMGIDGADRMDLGSAEFRFTSAVDPTGRLLAVVSGNEVLLYDLERLGGQPPRVVARDPNGFAENATPAWDPSSRRLAVCGATGEVGIWPADGNGARPLRRLKTQSGNNFWTGFSSDGAWLGAVSDKGAAVWDLAGPPQEDPLIYLKRVEGQFCGGALHPSGRWLATAGGGYGLALVRLGGPFTSRVQRGSQGARQVAFSPDGRTLYWEDYGDGRVFAWRLTGDAGTGRRTLFRPSSPEWGYGLAADPQGRFLVAMLKHRTVRIPLDGSEPVTVEALSSGPYSNPVGPRIGPRGRLVATLEFFTGGDPVAVVADLENGRRIKLDLGPGDWVSAWAFDPKGRLLLIRGRELLRWDPLAGGVERLLEGVPQPGGFMGSSLRVSDDGALAVYCGRQSVVRVDLERREAHTLPVPGSCTSVALDSSGRYVVSGDHEGTLYVQPVSGADPHLLYGHSGLVPDVAFSPDGRWLASGSIDGTVRLWPMPDMSKPAPHTLPYGELMARLERMTNLRAVPDAATPSGYTLRLDPTAYHGWREAPEW